MDLKEIDILGTQADGHWYYVSKQRMMRRLLADVRVDEVLDVGAGSGVFSRALLDAGVCERAVCVDPSYEEDSSVTYHGHQMLFRRSPPVVTQRLVLMMDVLEHVEDDLGLLRHYVSGMPADGYLLVTVPAFQFLWSGHDLFLGHKRRYTLSRIETLIQAAGLELVRGRYFYGLLLPLAALLRLADRVRMGQAGQQASSALRPCSSWLNRALILAHEVERHLLFPVNRLAGLTVACLARKPAG